MSPRTGPIGVLALQGDFDAHIDALRRCGVQAAAVRLPSQLIGLRGLVIPGGESTTLLRLMREYGFDVAVAAFVGAGGGVFGTCAGAILLARGVFSPSQWSLDLLDIDIERNAYGRQIDSFETRLTEVDREILVQSADDSALRDRHDDGADGSALQKSASLGAVFIRAPRIRRVGPMVRVLASHSGEPVLVLQGRVLVATFHPELVAEDRVHRYFLSLTGPAREPSAAAPSRASSRRL